MLPAVVFHCIGIGVAPVDSGFSWQPGVCADQPMNLAEQEKLAISHISFVHSWQKKHREHGTVKNSF